MDTRLERGDAPGIGDNLSRLTIVERLTETYADLTREIEEIAERANKAPREIKTEADLDVVGVIVKDVKAVGKRAETMRKAEKEPHVIAGREIDGWFGLLSDRLTRIEGAFTKAANAYHDRIAAERRAKAEAEARRAREEETRRLDAARKAEEDGRLANAATHTAAAEAAERHAEQAEAQATARPEELTRTTTASGVTASAKSEWTFAVENYDAIDVNKLKPYLKRDAVDAAVKMAVKMGVRELAGVKIYETTKSSFR
jgi:hypothetical protein